MGGHIWLYSEPGQGSTFKLYFPLHEAPADEERPVPAPLSERRTGTVMVVEDEESVREMTTMLLERAGYRVVSVPDGVAALTEISEGTIDIDVLVTDVVMPRMSGVKLAERMIERYPSIGLVLLSGYLAETLDLSFVISQGARFVSETGGIARIAGCRGRRHGGTVIARASQHRSDTQPRTGRGASRSVTIRLP